MKAADKAKPGDWVVCHHIPAITDEGSISVGVVEYIDRDSDYNVAFHIIGKKPADPVRDFFVDDTDIISVLTEEQAANFMVLFGVEILTNTKETT